LFLIAAYGDGPFWLADASWHLLIPLGVVWKVTWILMFYSAIDGPPWLCKDTLKTNIYFIVSNFFHLGFFCDELDNMLDEE
jgi:hypothetical protein